MVSPEFELPVDAVLPALRAALSAGPCAVLVAPPGAGKTTRVPLALLAEPWVGGGKIVLLSPRRIAARAAAARLAQSLGEPVGERVGYRVRLESKVSARTRIEVVTEGVFTRMILADPSLAGVAAVLFDEFHERSLEADLGLALAREAQQGLRDDLRLVVMSATLEAARVAALLGAAPVVRSEGRMHPVAVRYLGRGGPGARLEEEMAAALRRAVREEPGSILAFLPGRAEIERVMRRLESEPPAGPIQMLALHGGLDPAAQDAAIAPAAVGTRKIVLATAIAETSLTIEGVRVVVDSGYARRPAYEPATGLTRLETVRVSQAAAAQRLGRAGRTEPGVCYRLWDEPETRALAPFDRPEILEAELSGMALDLADWGVSAPWDLAWLDPPPRAAWAEARALLAGLGALDAEGRLTTHGRRMSAMALPTRLAHMALRAGEAGEAATATHLAMLLTEQGLGGRDPDARERLRAFLREEGPRARAARGEAARLARPLGGGGAPAPGRAGYWLAHAYPERVAKARDGEAGAFVLRSGRAAALPPEEPLARAPFLVAAEVQGGAQRARIGLAAPLTAQEVEALFGAEITRERDVTLDPATGAFRARAVRRLGRIVLAEAPLEAPAAADVEAAVTEVAQRAGLAALALPEEVSQLQARAALLRRVAPGCLPDLSDEALMERLAAWLPAAVAGQTTLAGVAGQVRAAIEALLSHADRRLLAERAPVRFETPAGGSAPIDYVCDGAPAVDVRLQELFGVTTHPAVAGGAAPLLLRLLSPAGRPVQTTRDLPGFWTGSYAAVRSDLRGRYPKHPWPEDPRTAPPTRRAKPRPS